jgi:hypothetical protein
VPSSGGVGWYSGAKARTPAAESSASETENGQKTNFVTFLIVCPGPFQRPPGAPGPEQTWQVPGKLDPGAGGERRLDRPVEHDRWRAVTAGWRRSFL